MGEVLKFEPPEASLESQRIANGAIDLIQEIGKRRETITEIGEKLTELSGRLEEVDKKLDSAESAKDFGDIIFDEIEPLRMEMARLLAEKRRISLEKIALASDLQTIRESKWGEKIQMPETNFSPAEEAWFAKGEKITSVMSDLAAMKEEEILAAEDEFFSKVA